MSVLVTYVGGESVAGSKLKSANGWLSGNGTDNYGFRGLPAGYRDWERRFAAVGSVGYFRTSSMSSSDSPVDGILSSDGDELTKDYFSFKENGSSVRCLKD